MFLLTHIRNNIKNSKNIMKYKSSSIYTIICESKGNLFILWLCPGIHHFKVIFIPKLSVIYKCLQWLQLLYNVDYYDWLTVLLFSHQLHAWQPGIKNPYRGMVVWPVPENVDITVTLYRVWHLLQLIIQLYDI